MTAPFSELRITLARVKDSAVLSQVAARTFQDAYQEGNTAENIRLYLEENCRPEIFARELQEADKNFFLAWSVWEKAERARAFYGKWKFLEVGRALYRVGNDLQPDIIMERSISRKNVVSKHTAGS